ncbi:MAG: serine protease inhibitor ecotin [Cyclobacteriaceae bacterium]
MSYQVMFFCGLVVLLGVYFSCKPAKKIMMPSVEKAHDLSMYPKAEDGQARSVISLPKKEDESNYKVELFIGKTLEVDCNRHSLGGSLTSQSVKGWGYTYFDFQTDGRIMSTKKGCPEGSKKEKFVYYKSDLIRYNSRLPVVVYVPEGYEVKYKVWAREEVFHEK